MIAARLDVRDWLAIANGELTLPSEFQRLIAAWELVEVWRQSDLDRRNIEYPDLFANHLAPHIAATTLQNDVEWLTRLERLRGECPIRQLTGNRERKKTFAGPDDLQNLLWVLYTVRCNLVHGQKEPASPRDLLVASHAAAVLAHLATTLVP
ncbi:MAG: hypothetical protein WC211_10955 [Dehalococcoidia bacterium]